MHLLEWFLLSISNKLSQAIVAVLACLGLRICDTTNVDAANVIEIGAYAGAEGNNTIGQDAIDKGALLRQVILLGLVL